MAVAFCSVAAMEPGEKRWSPKPMTVERAIKTLQRFSHYEVEEECRDSRGEPCFHVRTKTRSHHPRDAETLMSPDELIMYALGYAHGYARGRSAGRESNPIRTPRAYGGPAY